VDEPIIQSEPDRYVAWRGEALAYKLVQLKFRELRDWARKDLGVNLDMGRFHEEMLIGGLPLDRLDARTNRWIDESSIARRLPDRACSDHCSIGTVRRRAVLIFPA
jgi:uncharacterized protein (DUF885 family)